MLKKFGAMLITGMAIAVLTTGAQAGEGCQKSAKAGEKIPACCLAKGAKDHAGCKAAAKAGCAAKKNATGAQASASTEEATGAKATESAETEPGR